MLQYFAQHDEPVKQQAMVHCIVWLFCGLLPTVYDFLLLPEMPPSWTRRRRRQKRA